MTLTAAAFGGALWIAGAVVPAHNVASTEMMRVLDDEHALIAAYVTMDTEAKRRAYAAADQEVAALKLAALEQSRQRLAQAEAATKAERRTATAKTAIRIEPVALAAAAPVGEPLPLVQLANVAPPRQVEGPVRTRLREFVSDVKRVPGWFTSAADWMAESVPVPSPPRGRFL
ncbi:MAG: hypothetical protein Q7T81_08985 [Pseudolabrys sp.]|nr:hypothetical protein [Pseudolabrys sp.]